MAADEKFTALNRELHKYLLEHGHNRDPLLAELADETRKLGQIAEMQIAAEQGTLMGILARAIGARNAVEVGTFTGYSAICIARALPPDGHLLCCDVNPQWTAIARRYWDRAGLAGTITLTLAPAIETLSALPSDYVLDFAFIDADKVNYRNYYEECLKRTRSNGLILIDNVLWGGSVIDPKNQTEDTKAIRALNDLIAHDQRVDAMMIPVSDGLTIVRKK
ncbi:MAG TPA: class I SAM-dependent methyltransferase [Candidatus Binataceae bacterium]|jgi:caffeoyl-CoA O-methyltransferase|nr:class I SAM-dependent methyltransferase [Candidatus Binataceae bacterium]